MKEELSEDEFVTLLLNPVYREDGEFEGSATLEVTEDAFDTLVAFADTKTLPNMDKIYRINDIKFIAIYTSSIPSQDAGD